MKLLAIGHSYVLAVNRSVLRALSDSHGFDVTIGAPQSYAGDLRPLQCEVEPEHSKVRIVPLPVRATRFPHISWYSPRAIQNLFTRESFDVVSIWEEPFIISGFQLAAANRRYTSSPLCFYSCQNLKKDYPPPFSWFEQRTTSWAEGWCAAGELVKDALCERGYERNRGEVLPLAVDTALFGLLSEDEKREQLRELGLNPPVVGFVGRFVKPKGISVLLDALSKLPKGQPWSALFLGSGPEEEAIRSWAIQHNAEARVRIKLVRHDEVPRYMGVMDILAVPSQTTSNWKEQFGRVIIEGFACGAAVIASDSGEIPYVVRNAGVIVPEADTARWAEELDSLLADSGRRAELARRGIERGREFSANSLAARYASFYRDLAKRQRRA